MSFAHSISFRSKLRHGTQKYVECLNKVQSVPGHLNFYCVRNRGYIYTDTE